MKEENHNSYKNIFKATALFGGVKIFQILIAVLRSKIIAMLIGPAGMGISNIFTNTIYTVNHITGCGLQTSAVREVAKAARNNEQSNIDGIITVLRFFVWITGIIGTLLVFFFSSYFSRISFGNESYSLEFKFLSIILLLMQINTGQVALLQGTFHYKELAKASLYGHILSLVVTIPFYYFFREKGIVPALIISYLVTLFFSWLYSKQINYSKIYFSFRELFAKGKAMMSLGVVLAFGSLIGNLSSYVMSLFLSNFGSIEDVGYYAAAMTIANNYIFMVLSAMSTDYVPRIAALGGDKIAQKDAINKQTILVITILLPLIVSFIVFAKLLIAILYTHEFYAIISMLQLFMVGMLFQAITWCLSYAVVAMGDSKVFLLTECYNFLVSISLKIVGFILWGLTGIGIAFIIDYVLEGALIWYVCYKKFSFQFTKEFVSIFIVVFLFCILSICISFVDNNLIKYVLDTILFIGSIIYAFCELNKRIGFLSLLRKSK